ncbi:MAG: 50S ribosomal protein L18 [Flavobacteriales bacterium]|nr:50S ribosomal protein L18 [Flavobacteriales bacterium]
MGASSNIRRGKIRQRVRQKVKGSSARPRLSVFRSNKDIYAQIINDEDGRTLVSASSMKDKKAHDAAGIAQAEHVGAAIAEKAKSAGIEQVVFDRNGYLYHGRVKALAEAARKAGLQF